MMDDRNYQFAKGFPRTRGDRPMLFDRIRRVRWVPPHARG